MLGSPLPAPPVGASVSWWEPWRRGSQNLRGRGVGARPRVRAESPVRHLGWEGPAGIFGRRPEDSERRWPGEEVLCPPQHGWGGNESRAGGQARSLRSPPPPTQGQPGSLPAPRSPQGGAEGSEPLKCALCAVQDLGRSVGLERRAIATLLTLLYLITYSHK